MKTVLAPFLGAALLISCASDPTPPEATGVVADALRNTGRIGSMTVVLEARGDEADVYYPVRAHCPWSDGYPVVGFNPGGNVDKSHYEQVATRLARFGFIVVVANHFQTFGPPGTPAQQIPDMFVFDDILQYTTAANEDSSSPLFGLVDTSRSGLVGHSVGGAVGLFTAQGQCLPPFCFGPWARPESLRAGVFYGTHAYGPDGSFIDFDTSTLPVALVHGSLDDPDLVRETYETLDGPRALVTIEGANHFGLTDENAPDGIVRDPNTPTIPQPLSVRLSARWMGIALSAWVHEDPFAQWLLYESGGFPRAHVSATAE